MKKLRKKAFAEQGTLAAFDICDDRCVHCYCSYLCTCSGGDINYRNTSMNNHYSTNKQSQNIGMRVSK